MLINSKATIKYEKNGIQIEIVLDSTPDGYVHIDKYPDMFEFTEMVNQVYSILNRLSNE